MNLRQRKFVRAYLESGGNGTAAAVAAGYSPRGAEVQAHRLLRDANIQAEIRRALSREGLTDERLFSVLLEGLRATRPNGHPDHHVRARYLDMAFRLRRDFETAPAGPPAVLNVILGNSREGNGRAVGADAAGSETVLDEVLGMLRGPALPLGESVEGGPDPCA